ncbi:MAG TPA: MauE/DoxX family redox-associated membrane protein [Steroidobacteraceae bacterium]|nr:MauE/DoxX family redox-associated membrane protein [Steroidobacteraceae bacterium]
MAAMIDPAIGTLLAGAFALLFASAALHKARDLALFAQIVAAYGVLPGAAGLAWLVPLAEALVSAGLLLPVTRWAAAATGSGLLLLYAAAMALNLLRGRRELSCGCGGPNERRPIAAWMVWRNLFLAGTLRVVSLPWTDRPLQPVDLLTVAAGVAVTALIYMSADGLLARIAPRTLGREHLP